MKTRLESLKKSNASISEITEDLAKVIGERVKIFSQDARSLPAEALLEIRQINDFIRTSPEIIAHENSALNGRETLLHKLFAGVPNDYAIQIIHHLISHYETFEHRPDLLEIMISDNTISSNPDMSETFDLLAQKNLPRPTDKEIAALLRSSRSSSGFNATKLAFSFLNYRQDHSLLQKINSATSTRENTREKLNLKVLLERRIFEGGLEHFHKCVGDLVLINDDSLLQKALSNKKSQKLLTESTNHSLALNLAAEHKFAETFRILINAGFNPLKHPASITNCFAEACKTQGSGTLELYLESIREKFGDEAVTEILREGETAMLHAIKGRAYISTINFLLDSGALVETKLSENLQTAAKLGHARAFELLLERGSLEDGQLEDVFNVVKIDGDYVIASIFMEYLKSAVGQTAKSQELKSALSEKKEQLTHQDLFRICQLSGEKTLQSYLDARPDYNLQEHINDFDGEGKTALYYAINDNAYNGLVKFLLDHGANPNQIAAESHSSTHLDAATLAIRNCEPTTLSLLLNSRKLNSASIRAAAAELIRPENNEIVLTEAFVNHVDAGEIRQLPLEVKQIMLQRSLESDRGPCIYKMRDSAKGTDLEFFIEDLFCKLIEEGNIKVVSAMIEKLEVRKMFLSQARRTKGPTETSERDALLSVSSINGYGASEEDTPKTIFKIPASSAKKLSDEQVDVKYADMAFELAKSSNEEESKMGKEIFKKIVSAGFSTSKSEREIKALKIDDGRGSTWCPSICCPSVCVVS